MSMNQHYQSQSHQQQQHRGGGLSSTSVPGRSASPQPASPVSPRTMASSTNPSGGSRAPVPANVMEIASRHYETLQVYLLAHILKEKHGVSEQRIAAREKLSKLLQNQLQDLSTDVYDELMRRKEGKKVPFLPVRDDFHPKRNQARQKLATLPENRFKDLASDVYVQLERQFPDLMTLYPLKALEEREFPQQHPPVPPPPPEPSSPYQSDREPTTPVVQQSSVVPNMATFTIQELATSDDEGAYNRAPEYGSVPASPTALEGNLAFSSLDGVMADIGSLPKDQHPDHAKANTRSAPPAAKESLAPRPPVGLGIDTGLNNVEKVKQQYEERIQVLCKRLQHLESEVGDGINRPEGSRLAQVERQLAKQIEMANETNTRLSKLQVEYNKVLNDYHSQLETVDLVQQEVKSLLMETRDLKQKQLDTEDELQLAYKKIKELEDENSDIKNDLDAALDQQKSDLDEIKALKAELDDAHAATAAAKAAASKLEAVNHQSAPASPPPQQQQHQNQYHSETDEPAPPKQTSLPPPPQQQQQQQQQQSPPPLRRQDSDDWQQTRQQNRMSMVGNPDSVIHPDSLNNFRNAIDDLLAAGRSDTSQDVLMSMKSVVVACKVVTEDVEDYELDTGNEDTFVGLKQELSQGLTQLMAAAKAHSTSFDADEDEFERTLSALEAAGDQLEAIVMDMVQVPKSNKPPKNDKSQQQQNSGYNQYDDDRYDSHHGGSSGPSNAQHLKHLQHSDFPPTPSSAHHDIREAQDLRMYLEKQTGQIVSSIQTLLPHLRSSSDVDEICQGTDKVIEFVDELIRTTRDAMGLQSVRASPTVVELLSQGDLVLEDLENAVEDLNEMKARLEREPELVTSASASNSSEAKGVKQKLASASFNIANFAKELVGLIDDE